MVLNGPQFSSVEKVRTAHVASLLKARALDYLAPKGAPNVLGVLWRLKGCVFVKTNCPRPDLRSLLEVCKVRCSSRHMQVVNRKWN